MDAIPVVLDISSDDEPWFEALPENFDYDRLKEFLGVSDVEADDSDDVVIVSEVKANPKKNPEPEKDQDDDCVVLDGDPDKLLSAGEEPDNGSDEIIVVGQKGQIACRDYPHPRHHCARFPFASTPHEKHCHQCHCYVCDSLAPCLYWGTGISDSDHCHATDKTEIWKIRRRDLKQGHTATSPTLKPVPEMACSHANHDVNLNVLVVPNSTIQKQVSGSINTRTHHPLPYFIIQNQLAYLSRLNTTCIGSSTVNAHAPHPVNRGQNQVSGGLLAKSRHRDHLVQNQALCSNTRRDPGQLTPTGCRFRPTSVMLKRPGTTGVARRVARSACNSLGGAHLVTVTKNEGNTSSGASNRCLSNEWSCIPACTNPPSNQFTDHPNLVDMNRLPPQPDTCFSSLVESKNGLEFYHLGDRHQGIHNNGYQGGGRFQNLNEEQDGGGFHSMNQQGNKHPIITVFQSINHQGYPYHYSGDGGVVVNNRPSIDHQDRDGFQGIIQQENQYQVAPHDNYQCGSLCMNGQNILQQGNLIQNADHLVSEQGTQSQSMQNTDYSADALRCVDNTIQSDHPLLENVQAQQKAGCRDGPPGVPESISPYSGNAVDLEFEKWLSESQSPLMSPEAQPIDAGMLLFDFPFSGEI